MMRKPFRSHGSHCYLRSFQTTCSKCGDEVLYWECTHGSKLFFNYPPYGKLIRHICRRPPANDPKKNYPVIVKKPNGLLVKASPSCPVCGKIFRNEDNLNEHLNQLKKRDKDHIRFFSEEGEEENKVEIEPKNDFEPPRFGRINIKKQTNKTL